MVSTSDVNWKTNPDAATLPDIGVGDIAVLNGEHGGTSLHFRTMVDSADGEYLSLIIAGIYEWHSKALFTLGTPILELQGEKIIFTREYVFYVGKAQSAS